MGFSSVKDNTFPAHFSLRNPIMNTLFRDWATLKFALLSTCHATSYPNSSSEPRMVANVLPESCDNNPGTFSSSRYLGFLTAAILAISKNRVPLASSNPPLFPAIEKLWQGKPPHIRSKSGNSFGLIFLSRFPIFSIKKRLSLFQNLTVTLTFPFLRILQNPQFL